ncbi:hypothetical protein BDN70DRAFT_928685 [Pholiota conissans]|uniref:Uncharacterized protein n=1 Tax=Pholiota conissans TaxID=109636 RepID=A0A9P5ZAZ3_9AGAR|nr:hypothetical protein BDN70DRAFT_928685 [Pholiota conissans]
MSSSKARDPLNYGMIHNMLNDIDLQIRRSAPIRVVMVGPASVILAEGNRSKDSFMGDIDLAFNGEEETKVFLAARDVVSKKNKRVLNFTIKPFPDENRDRTLLYNESLKGDCIFYGKGLAVYAAEWAFQVAFMIRSAIKWHHGETDVSPRSRADLFEDEKLLQAIQVLVHVVKRRNNGAPVCPKGKHGKYCEERALTPENVSYMRSAYVTLFEIQPPF